MYIEFKNGEKLDVINGEVWGREISKEGIERKHIDYRAMVQAFTDDCLILNNEIIKHIDDFYIENGSDYDEETGNYVDVFQYFIIDGNSAENFERFTDEIIYYSEKLDMYLLGVTHFGTAWNGVMTDYEIKED